GTPCIAFPRVFPPPTPLYGGPGNGATFLFSAVHGEQCRKGVRRRCEKGRRFDAPFSDAYHLTFTSHSRRAPVGRESRVRTMDKKKIESYKKRLEERQQELRRVVSRNVQDGRDADRVSAQDIADKASDYYT